MRNPLIRNALSAARWAYRTLLPVQLRRRVRAGLESHPQPAPPLGPRRFELALPRPAQPSRAPAGRPTSLVFEAPRQLYVARHLHEGGLAGYEPATAAVMLGIAELIHPSVVFDIGANVGPHALLLPAVLDVPVVAFEPAADVAAVLRNLIAINALRCTVEEIALGEEDGTATFFISPTDTSSSLRPGFRDSTGEVTVPVRSLDSYVRSSGLQPSLLKIDTETTEPAVLRGASELLAHRPWIVCELLPGWTEVEIEGLLRPLGYHAFPVVDRFPLVELDTIVGHASFEDTNFLFAPEPPDAALWDAVERWRRAIDECPPPRDLPPLASS